jgi:hypothetical protein
LCTNGGESEFSRRKRAPAFLENFESIKKRIRSAPGNLVYWSYIKDNKSIFSYIAGFEETWYRNSGFFNEVWSLQNYSVKLRLWSVDKLALLLV